MTIEFVCDRHRHLVCVPFSVENLHRMADELGLKRCWFHADRRLPHYDIPKKRIAEIMASCRVVSAREILEIIKSTAAPIPGAKSAVLPDECPARAGAESGAYSRGRIVRRSKDPIVEYEEMKRPGTFRQRA